MHTELIIFDCDGTLSDSEVAHNKVISDLLADMGYPLYTLDYCLENFAGRGMPYVMNAIETREDIRLPESFLTDYTTGFVKSIPTSVKPVEHAVESVDLLSKDYKICVASNGEFENIMESVKALGLYDYFGDERIFSKDQVERGKPAPDLFLFAAEQMGVAPEKAVVVEDSVTGVKAGAAAGMITLGITAAHHEPLAAGQLLKAAGATAVFGAWHEVTDYIKQHCG